MTNMPYKPILSIATNENDRSHYREAFSAFDWTNSGRISYGNLQNAMRRCGHNPTDVEVSDIINKIHDDTGSLDLEDFYNIMEERNLDLDPETGYKECFRAFSKDDSGCITAEEMKFVLMHLPGKISYKEIDQMIKTVDKNEDWKISYSEFRVMLGAIPLVLPDVLARNKLENKMKLDI